MKFAICLLLSLGSFSLRSEAQSFESKIWGQSSDGEDVHLVTLRNRSGLTARVISFGATLIGIDAPDRDGKFENVTLYLDSLEDYLGGHPVLGSTIGRYANRINTGGFTIDGVRHDLDTVNEKTGIHIHGGKTGFQWQNWKMREPVVDGNSVNVTFSIESAHEHEGFPGNLTANVTYSLTDKNELRIFYEAITDKPTHVNLTNHAYFNLDGAGNGNVLDHVMEIHSDEILEVDDRKIPTGNLIPVKGTPFDFTTAKKIGADISDVAKGGYDHTFVIARKSSEASDKLSFAAEVRSKKSGRVMRVYTTEPGFQLYTANFLSDKLSGGGKNYGPRHGLCIECQHHPDSPNKPQFPGTLLRPGETYQQSTVYQFQVLAE